MSDNKNKVKLDLRDGTVSLISNGITIMLFNVVSMFDDVIFIQARFNTNREDMKRFVESRKYYDNSLWDMGCKNTEFVQGLMENSTSIALMTAIHNTSTDKFPSRVDDCIKSAYSTWYHVKFDKRETLRDFDRDLIREKIDRALRVIYLKALIMKSMDKVLDDIDYSDIDYECIRGIGG